MRLPETPLPKDAAMPFTPPAAFTTRPTLEGHFGMAASTHWLATAASQAVLERGATPSTRPWPGPSSSMWSNPTSMGRAAT